MNTLIKTHHSHSRLAMRSGLEYMLSEESRDIRASIARMRLTSQSRGHDECLDIIVRKLHQCSRQNGSCKNCPNLRLCVLIYYSLC